MPKLGEDKVGLYVVISKKLEDELRRFIVEKYGKFKKGLLSAEVEAAIQAWIASHTKTHTEKSLNSPNPLPMYFKVYQQVKRWLAEVKGVDVSNIHQVPRRVLEQAITHVRGSDPRTIRKWLDIFTKQRLIKWITPEVVELVG